jgi:hypothetical protein
MKIKNTRLNQIIIGLLVTLAIIYVIKNVRGSEEKYEGSTGPATGPATETKITAEDLKAVMKFIG